MAKAIRTCPHCNTETMTFVAKSRREVERFADWKLESGAACDACTAERRETESQRAAEQAREKGLPALLGTEKQVAWAESIRAELMQTAEQLMVAVTRLQAGDVEAAREAYRSVPVTWQPSAYSFRSLAIADDQHAEAALAVCHLLAQQKDAGWWIDYRGASFEALARAFGQQVLDAMKGAPSQDELVEEVVVRPENPISPLIAEITLGEEAVSVSFPDKSEAFLGVVKPLGYHFNWSARAHRKRIYPTMGSVEDRAAELMHRLLLAGFVVSCQRHGVREKALETSYEPIYPRWMRINTRGRMAGWLNVLTRDGLDLSKDLAALNARASYWQPRSWYVRPEHYAALLDIAEVHGFRLTEGAWQALKKAQAASEASLLVAYLPDVPTAKALTREPEQVVPTDIDPELRDD